LYHPDNNPKQDKNAEFIKIREAYDCLKDYNLRR
jgi:DnaJ-class molecular chaperone